MGDHGPRPPYVVVVSGLPRSGTSMMMRLLAEGGAEILADGERSADEDNPRGYFELEAVKHTQRDASWVRDAPGRVVKVVSPLLSHLPTTHAYRVIFMHRSLDQVVRSQRVMLDRLGTTPAGEDEGRARRLLAEHLAAIVTWLDGATHLRMLGVSYERVLVQPRAEIERVTRFLELDLDAGAMVRAVEPALQRQR